MALINRDIIAIITTAVLCAKSLQSCLGLCDPMDRGPPGSSDHGIFPARILEWVAMSSSRGSSRSRDRTHISCIECRFFAAEYNINNALWYYAAEFHLYTRKFMQPKTMKWTQFYWWLNNIFFFWMLWEMHELAHGKQYTSLVNLKWLLFTQKLCGCKSWAIKKAEYQRIDAFELWCWRRLLRVP